MTIDITPDTEGMVRWLRHVYETDEDTAIIIAKEGWPWMCISDVTEMLAGRVELAEIHRRVTLEASGERAC